MKKIVEVTKPRSHLTRQVLRCRLGEDLKFLASRVLGRHRWAGEANRCLLTRVWKERKRPSAIDRMIREMKFQSQDGLER